MWKFTSSLPILEVEDYVNELVINDTQEHCLNLPYSPAIQDIHKKDKHLFYENNLNKNIKIKIIDINDKGLRNNLASLISLDQPIGMAWWDHEFEVPQEVNGGNINWIFIRNSEFIIAIYHFNYIVGSRERMDNLHLNYVRNLEESMRFIAARKCYLGPENSTLIINTNRPEIEKITSQFEIQIHKRYLEDLKNKIFFLKSVDSKRSSFVECVVMN